MPSVEELQKRVKKLENELKAAEIALKAITQQCNDYKALYYSTKRK